MHFWLTPNPIIFWMSHTAKITQHVPRVVQLTPFLLVSTFQTSHRFVKNVNIWEALTACWCYHLTGVCLTDKNESWAWLFFTYFHNEANNDREDEEIFTWTPLKKKHNHQSANLFVLNDTSGEVKLPLCAFHFAMILGTAH